MNDQHTCARCGAELYHRVHQKVAKKNLHSQVRILPFDVISPECRCRMNLSSASSRHGAGSDIVSDRLAPVSPVRLRGSFDPSCNQGLESDRGSDTSVFTRPPSAQTAEA